MSLERLRNLNYIYQKRTLRVLIGHTEATPYPVFLDPSLRNTDGSVRIPTATDTLPLARSAAAFTYGNSLLPGLVLVRTAGDNVTVHNGAAATPAIQAVGLLGNFIGGDLDELYQNNETSAWRGKNAQVQVLAPAFDPTGLSAAYNAAAPGNPVPLYAGADGRLTTNVSGTNRQLIANLVEYTSPAEITIDLQI